VKASLIVELKHLTARICATEFLFSSIITRATSQALFVFLFSDISLHVVEAEKSPREPKVEGMLSKHFRDFEVLSRSWVFDLSVGRTRVRTCSSKAVTSVY
jgi:hypothetical protein